MTATGAPFCERIVVGPRRGGRDYDVLATSRGLTLAVEDLGRLRRHNFEVRPFARPGEPVCAFLRLRASGLQTWLIATTSQDSEINGNPVWITSGLVLTANMLDLVSWRVLPLAPQSGGSPPAPGSTLETVPIYPRPSPSSVWMGNGAVTRAARRLARSRLALETPPGVRQAVLSAVLEQTPVFRRSGLSFMTAPPEAAGPGDLPELCVFEAGSRGPSAPKGYQLVSLDGTAVEPPGPVAADGWDEFLELAAAERRAAAEGLDRTSRSLPLNVRLSAQADMQLRVEAYLDGLAGPAEQADSLFFLVKAAHRVGDEEARGHVVGALFKAFERRLKASPDPQFWLTQYLRKLDAAMRPVGPPLLAPRLAVETGVVFALEDDLAERVAPAIVEDLAALATDALARAPRRSAAAMSVLLQAVVDRLISVPCEPRATVLGQALAEAIAEEVRLRRATDSNSGQSMAGFIERLVLGRQLLALTRFRRSGTLSALRDGAAGAPIEKCLAVALQAMRRERPASRAELALALAIWRLGKTWVSP